MIDSIDRPIDRSTAAESTVIMHLRVINPMPPQAKPDLALRSTCAHAHLMGDAVVGPLSMPIRLLALWRAC